MAQVDCRSALSHGTFGWAYAGFLLRSAAQADIGETPNIWEAAYCHLVAGLFMTNEEARDVYTEMVGLRSRSRIAR
jgi:hypothetical protein